LGVTRQSVYNGLDRYLLARVYRVSFETTFSATT